MPYTLVRVLLLCSFLQEAAVQGFQPAGAATTTRLSSSSLGPLSFVSGTGHREAGLALHVATASKEVTVEVVEGGEDDPRVLDVAAFRNGMVNPEMMVERAQNKRDAVDTTAAAVDGLKIGVLYIGPLIAGFTYLESNDVMKALANYALLGGGIGSLLAANNYMGRGIHVPDIPEATK